MHTLIRLKRPRENTPSDTLILNYNSKKRKIDTSDGDEEPLSTILKFTGTQQSTSDNISEHVVKIRQNLKDDIIKNFRHQVNLTEKLRIETRERSKSDRYKIVNCSRPSLSEDFNDCVTVLDLELEQEDKSDRREFVYDCYYTTAKIPEENNDYEFDIVEPSVEFGSGDLYADSDNDSDDSNAENYYTNDYPDESECESIDEDDIVDAMNNMELDNTLSSSDDDDVHYDTNNHSDYCEYSNDEEVGSRYRKFFKKFHMNGSSSEEEETDSESNDSYN